MILTFSAENANNSQSNGTAVNTASGFAPQGNGWDTNTTGSGATKTYSTTQAAHGAFSVSYTTGVTAVTNYAGWTSASLTAAGTLFLCCYGYFSGSVPNVRFMELRGGGSLAAGVATASSKFIIVNSAGTTVATSSTTVPTGSWFRIEFRASAHASYGQVEARIYLTKDSSTADEILQVGGVNTGSSLFDAVNFGAMTTVASLNLYLDDMLVQDTYWPGPSMSPAIYTNNAEGATLSNLTTADSGGNSGTPFDYIFTSGGATIQPSGNYSHGIGGYDISDPSNGIAFFAYNGLNTSTLALRLYLTQGLGAGTIAGVYDTASNLVMTIGKDSSGKLYLMDASSSIVAQGTVNIDALSNAFRIELLATMGAGSTGTATFVYYIKDSVTSLEAPFVLTAKNFGSLPFNAVLFGKFSGSSAINTWSYDDICVSPSLTKLIGPATTIPPYYEHTAEGATLGTSISTNSGETYSSTYWGNTWDLDSFFINTASVTYSNTQSAHGSQSLYLTCPSVGDQVQLVWYTKSALTPVSTAAARVYLRLNSLPGSTADIMQFIGFSGSAAPAIVRVNTSGAVILANATGTTLKTFTAFSLNTWYRIELQVVIGSTTSNGTINCAAYAGDSLTVFDSYSSTAANAGTNLIQGVMFGNINASSGTLDAYMDDFAADLHSAQPLGIARIGAKAALL